ncbi:hypothetical protein GEV33_004324 [Tenebrio molitor]|uniref:Uncharacterized protein n=1 Tax=Tenebrio molitor TaxID=7067 RepID=A0A8J6LFZ5_TENMO|nr:hypothetical protein GEV33_004324 [Tenebrio molitor]
MRRYVRPIRRAAAPLGPGPIRLLSPVYKYNPGALFRGNDRQGDHTASVILKESFRPVVLLWSYICIYVRLVLTDSNTMASPILYLTPLDFNFWGHTKDLVYEVEINTKGQLQKRVTDAANQIRKNPEMLNSVYENWYQRKCHGQADMESIRKATRENHPKDDANFISHFLFCWQLPLLVKGWSNKITSDDFNTPLKCHDSKKLSDKLEKHWEEEINVSKKPSLTRVLTKLYGLEYLFYGLVYFCFDLAITAQWNAGEEVLSDVNFSAEVGELVGIAGGAGSGKSTLLQVILKELEPTRGSVDVEMNISYAPQEPWIFSASVKQNILFGEELDESRYLKVLRMCALERDLSVFPFGDNTLVGERGVMLSGGQKARIGLARAVYRNAEIYLLDDPLSAVDGHVADHIFKECLMKFLRNKCLVLVTHQIHFLRNANKIYFLSNGKMMQDGKSELLESLEEKLKTNTNTTALEELPALNYQLEVKEDEGKAGNSYKSYCLAGGKGMTGLVLVLFVLVQILSNMVDGFVAFWVNIHQDSVNLVPQIYNFFTDQNCVYIYGALLIVLVFVCHAAVWANVKFCKKASENLHKNLLGKVLVASMSFFNNHSSGRVINRFSKDMGTIDEFIPMTLMEVTTLILSSVGASIVVIIVDFWMIIPSVMLSFVVYFYYAAFQYTIRKFRRMEGTRRSPIFTHLVASVQGLSVIRASNAQKILQEEFDSHQDRHSSCFYLYKALYFAFAFWTEVTCSLYNVVLIYSLLYFENGSYTLIYRQNLQKFFTVTVGGSVGLMITQMIVLTSSLQYVMTLMASLDAEMVSAARVVEYMDVTPEKDDATVIPSPAWPNAGKITFERVSMRYYLDKELVLKEISVKIQPKEKIGIVGRTGAGKSSLISVLFCLFEFEGTVSIDGIDTKSVPLSTLRSRISIIPQEPVLFLGTLRKNLDSFGEFSDSELWSALEDVGLKKMVSGLQSGLDSLVSEGGSNFSVGEKQLLCLVRAIVKNTKIVVLDEATASVDLEADDMIQRAIRRNFKNSTMLTIAHRLNTVMDSDKIMVMDSGRVVEFGDPKELLENPDGHFYRYVSSSLVKIPKKKYN